MEKAVRPDQLHQGPAVGEQVVAAHRAGLDLVGAGCVQAGEVKRGTANGSDADVVPRGGKIHEPVEDITQWRTQGRLCVAKITRDKTRSRDGQRRLQRRSGQDIPQRARRAVFQAQGMVARGVGMRVGGGALIVHSRPEGRLRAQRGDP